MDHEAREADEKQMREDEELWAARMRLVTAMQNPYRRGHPRRAHLARQLRRRRLGRLGATSGALVVAAVGAAIARARRRSLASRRLADLERAAGRALRDPRTVALSLAIAASVGSVAFAVRLARAA